MAPACQSTVPRMVTRPPTPLPTTAARTPTGRTAIAAPTAESPSARRRVALGRQRDTARMAAGMLDLGHGPFVVGVADRVEALEACATLAPDVRPFDLVEARVDLFSGQRLEDADLDACARLEASGTPVLVTIRSEGQGGRFAAGDAERLARFRAALAVASWADVEDDAGIIDDVAALARARPGGQLVVSHHDFAATPPLDLLLAFVDRCHAAAPGAVAKVATAVKSADDRAALRTLLARRPERTAVIGMGAVDDGLRVELVAALRRAPTALGGRCYLTKQLPRSGAPISAPRPTHSNETGRPFARVPSIGSFRVANVALTVSNASPVPSRTTMSPS